MRELSGVPPICIEIALHYYGCANDYRDGDFSAPAVREWLEWLKGEEMLRARNQERELGRAAYVLTDRGRVWIEAMLATPLPVSTWVVPAAADEARP